MHDLKNLWTELRLLTLLALIAVGVAGALVGVGGGGSHAALVVVAIVVLLAAFHAGPLLGLAIGSAGAAGALWLSDHTFTALHDEPVSSQLVSLAALICTGWLAGVLGDSLRRLQGRAAQPASAPGAVRSLGLLPAEVGERFLDAELLRTRRTGRPVTLLLFTVTGGDPLGADPEDERARRALARTIESVVRETDVPFSASRRDLAVVLTDTDGSGAVAAADRVVHALTGASFMDRAAGKRVEVLDRLALHVGVAFGDEQQTARDMLMAATRTEISAAAEARPVAPADHTAQTAQTAQANRRRVPAPTRADALDSIASDDATGVTRIVLPADRVMADRVMADRVMGEDPVHPVA